MKSLETDVDIILLTEIGREGYRYLTSTFPDYNYEIDLPKNNSYGGWQLSPERTLSWQLKGIFN